MANTDYGAVLLTTCEATSQALNHRLGVSTGFKPSEWADNINLLVKPAEKSASGSVAHFTDGLDMPLVSLSCDITAWQEGTGTPSPSNVRAIHGYTGMNIVRTGKNLFDKSVATDDKYIAVTGLETASNGKSHSMLLPFEPSTSYYMSGYAGNSYYSILALDKDMNPIANWYGGASKTSAFTATAPSNARWCYLNFNTDQKDTLIFCKSVDVVPFSAYNGTTYLLTWQTECFGGYIDYKRGKKVTTYWKIDLGSGTWVYHPAGSTFTDYFDYTMPSGHEANVINGSTLLNGVCSCYNIVPSGQIALSQTDAVISVAINKRRIIICDTRYTDGDDLKEYLDGKVLVYELATPIEEDITLPVISSLLGENNIWADSGDSQVVYRGMVGDSFKCFFNSQVTSGWTGTSVERTMLTVTGNGNGSLSFDNDGTGRTNCSNSDGYISVKKNGTAVYTKSLAPNTDETLAIPVVNFSTGDVITLVFGFANYHSNINMKLTGDAFTVQGSATVSGISNTTNTSTTLEVST